MTVAEPTATPVTRPDVETVAIDGVPDTQVVNAVSLVGEIPSHDALGR